MSSRTNSTMIAELLSELYNESKNISFLLYVKKNFSTNIVDLPNFRCLYIIEMEEGNIKSGPRGGLRKAWWQIDDYGFREISSGYFDTDNTSIYFHTPIILFYREDNVVVTYEHLGNDLVCWKRGSVNFDVKATWVGEPEVINCGSSD